MFLLIMSFVLLDLLFDFSNCGCDLGCLLWFCLLFVIDLLCGGLVTLMALCLLVCC